MSKADADEMREEYDLAALDGGVRGKYAAEYARGTNLVRLDPDVARFFKDDEAVNQTLRAALAVAESIDGKS